MSFQKAVPEFIYTKVVGLNKTFKGRVRNKVHVTGCEGYETGEIHHLKFWNF